MKTAQTKNLTLFICCVTQLMSVIDSSILSIALPELRRDLGFTAATLPWVITAFAIPLASLLMLAGRLSDRIGARRVLICGTVLFALSSLAAGLAPTAGALIAARAFQGAGAAFMSTSCLVLLTRTFANGTERAKAFGLWAAAGGSGGAIGVLLGGVLTEFAGWRWTLLINVPIGLMLALLALLVSAPRPTARPSLDLLGTAILGVATTCLTLGLALFSDPATPTLVSWGCIGLAVAATIVFLGIERNASNPLLPREALRSPALGLLSLTRFLVGASMAAFFYFTGLNLQLFQGLSALAAGIAFLPLSLCAFLAGAQSWRLQKHMSGTATTLLGLAIMVAGLVGTAATARIQQPAWIILFAAVYGIGMGIALSSLTSAATATLPPHLAGTASGILTTSQQLGNSVGMALVATTDALIPTAWHGTGFTTIAVLGIVSLAPLATLLRPQSSIGK